MSFSEQRTGRNVRVTKAMRGADCWTDNHLIISKTKLYILPKIRPQGQTVAKKLNVNKLKLPSIQEELAATLESQLTDATRNDWDSLKTTVRAAASQVFGLATRNNQDWFDENDVKIKTLLEEKRQLDRAQQSDPQLRLEERRLHL